MNPSVLTALSPLDGRYAPKLAALRPLLSEFGLMHRRVQVEVEWFIALSDAGLPELAPLAAAARAWLRRLVEAFAEVDAQAIKDIERTTNHDVKAVEYWLKSKFADVPELARAFEVVPGSPAQKAGIQKDDVFLSIDGEAIANPGHVSRIVAARGCS